MPSPLATVVAAPTPITIGGNPYALHPLRYLEWGRYERWYQAHAIALLLSAGVSHEDAAYAASRIYGRSEPVSASRLTIQGQMAITWLGIREAIPLDQVAAEITDAELVAAIDAFLLLNCEPRDPKAQAPKGAMAWIRRTGFTCWRWLASCWGGPRKT